MDEDQKNKIDGASMLLELDFPTYTKHDFVKCTYDNFSLAIGKLVAYYIEASKIKKSGKGRVIALVLYGRCVNDLLAGFHLVTHGYINQFYSITRNILESLDQIELFLTDEAMASHWLELEDDVKTRINEFSPSAVRKKLGKPGYDEIYGFFCEEGSHPSMQSFRSFSAIEIKKDNPNTLVVQLGPTDFLYPVVFSIGFSYILLMSISISLIKHFPLGNQEKLTYLKYQLSNMENSMEKCLKSKLDTENKESLEIFKGLMDSISDLKTKIENNITE